MHTTSDVLTVGLNPTLQRTVLIDRLVPGSIHHAQWVTTDPSGKGINVTRVLRQLGVSVMHLCPDGGDERPLLREMFRDAGIRAFQVSGSAPLRRATTIVSGGDFSATEIIEPAPRLDTGFESRLLAVFGELAGQTQWVAISGSYPPGISPTCYRSMVDIAHRAGVPVALDIRGECLRRAMSGHPEIVKINLEEARLTFGGHSTDAEPKTDAGVVARRIVEEVYAQYNTRMIITNGPLPTIFCADGAAESLVPDTSFDPVNTTGCGDAFLAGVLSVLVNGGTFVQAVEKGSQVAGQNARTATPGAIQ